MNSQRPGQWTTKRTLRTVYSSWWVTLRIDEVERPDGSLVEHEVIDGPESSGVVVYSPTRGLLMIWRHRFMPDTWGWEIPAGVLEAGESPIQAARRECLEETGWSVAGPLEHLSSHHPSCGLINQTLHVFLARGAEQRAEPPDPNEAVVVEWRSLEQVQSDLRSGQISDGYSQLGLAFALAEILPSS